LAVISELSEHWFPLKHDTQSAETEAVLMCNTTAAHVALHSDYHTVTICAQILNG
jgi:hypothetical protein